MNKLDSPLAAHVQKHGVMFILPLVLLVVLALVWWVFGSFPTIPASILAAGVVAFLCLEFFKKRRKS